MKTQRDRIERALEIIESGKVYSQGNGIFRVLTERFAGGYTVTITSCDCADFEARKEGDLTPCKHQWAAIGATAAMLIDAIRKASSLPSLEAVGKSFADAMANLPEAFIKIARNEYRSRHCELGSKNSNGNGGTKTSRTVKASVKATVSHMDSSGMMLIKPQPKSNGSYNGIEV